MAHESKCPVPRRELVKSENGHLFGSKWSNCTVRTFYIVDDLVRVHKVDGLKLKRRKARYL